MWHSSLFPGLKLALSLCPESESMSPIRSGKYSENLIDPRIPQMVYRPIPSRNVMKLLPQLSELSYSDRQTDRRTDGQTDRQTDGQTTQDNCITCLVLGLSPWLSGLIRFLSHSTCWTLLADDLRWPGFKSRSGVSFQLVGLMAGML